jgi:hypothetical protein
MIWIGTKLNDNYGWEFAALYKYRNFSDGLTLLDVDVNWDRYLTDHTPRWEIAIRILNFTLFEFSIYYLWHRDEPEAVEDESHVWKTNSTSLTPDSLVSTTSSPSSEAKS